MATMKKISSNLWFDNQAEAAATFYTTVFKKAAITRTTYFGKAGFEIHHQPEGRVMTVEFQLEGSDFVALNGGPDFKFSEAISFIVNCDSQEEVDYYWTRLSAGGDASAQQCGWLKDKFGVSWQVVPVILSEMMTSTDKEKSERVMTAMLGMKKLDIAELERAYKGK